MLRLPFFKRENHPPIIPHVHDRPAATRTFVEATGKSADLRFAVVRPFALGISVVHEETKAQTWTSRLRLAQVCSTFIDCSSEFQQIETGEGIDRCEIAPVLGLFLFDILE